MASLVFWPAALEDAELASDLITASYPELPEDPVLKHYFWGHPRTQWRTSRLIAELDGEPAALVGWTHGPWEHLPARNCYVEVYLDRARLGIELAMFLLERVATDAQADGEGVGTRPREARPAIGCRGPRRKGEGPSGGHRHDDARGLGQSGLAERASCSRRAHEARRSHELP